MQGNRQLNSVVRTISKAQCLTAPRSLLSSVALFSNRDSNKQVHPAICNGGSSPGLCV